MPKIKLHWQILIAIVLAVITGLITGAPGESALGANAMAVYDFVGTLFVSALKMIIVPLIMSSVIIGVAGIAREGRLGALGGKTLAFYMGTGLIAVVIGLLAVNIAQPGFEDGQPVGDQLALDQETQEVVQQVERGDTGDLVGVFYMLIPDNLVAAASDNGALLGLIFFSLLFGFFMTRVKEENADTLYRFWDGIFDVMMKITFLVMQFAPIGVFGLVAQVSAETGFSAAGPLAVFALTVVVALAVHVFIVMPLLVKIVTGHNPYRLFRAMGPALLTAFSTASSMATLPVTMDTLRKNANVSQKTTSFVLPLGATVNMNGTALYECVAAMFIAQAYGLDLNLGVQFTVVVAALVTSIGVAGVPMASMVAIGIILTAVGLPMEALGVLFVFDRILDMLRTATNVYGDGICSVIVAHLEGEKDILPDWRMEKINL